MTDSSDETHIPEYFDVGKDCKVLQLTDPNHDVDSDWEPSYRGLSLQAHIGGTTIKLIDSQSASLDNILQVAEKSKIQELFKSYLASDSHFEVIKANTEAFIGPILNDDKVNLAQKQDRNRH